MRNIIILALMSFLMVFQSHAEKIKTISDDTYLYYEKEAVTNWIIKQTKEKVTNSYAKEIVNIVYKQSYETGIDPLMVIGIISKESMFRKTARSGYGAVGLMQVVPRFHQDKIKKRDIINRKVNIEVGMNILYNCLKSRKTVPGALNCYSGGAKNYSSYVQSRHNEIKTAIVLNLFENNKSINVNYTYNKPLIEKPLMYAGI